MPLEQNYIVRVEDVSSQLRVWQEYTRSNPLLNSGNHSLISDPLSNTPLMQETATNWTDWQQAKPLQVKPMEWLALSSARCLASANRWYDQWQSRHARKRERILCNGRCKLESSSLSNPNPSIEFAATVKTLQNGLRRTSIQIHQRLRSFD